MPGAEMPANLPHHPRVINHAGDPHGVLADGTAERVAVQPALPKEFSKKPARLAESQRALNRKTAPG